MIGNKEIIKFCDKNEYNLRVNNNGRWIDQKCTPDVICIVSDCILNFLDENMDCIEFSSTDIWKSSYTKENVEEIFSKPGTDHEKSVNEYDKFFAQPIELLANSQVLKKVKKKNRNFYTVNNKDILKYISWKEKNAADFLYIYIQKVLKDSGLWDCFTEFFEKQNQEAYIILKEKYENYIIKNTKINKKLEVRRIFSKVINPLAFKLKKYGTYRGRISKQIITYSSLMYNQENFRDLISDKPKNVTRQEWMQQKGSQINAQFYKYQSAKAKKQLKQYNKTYRNGNSEVNDNFNQGEATQVHHIFPQHSHPEISGYVENLICLTPTQHLYKAHPNNNTQIIDYEYQEILLKSKVNIMQNDIENIGDSSIYDFKNIIEVINVGFNKNYEIENNDFIKIMNIINLNYISL
ncbi:MULTISPECIES: hypothetical protein [unclassified Staphylococcus]|uniref:hypothetical protein n=1 Tax=Staphylococcus TaxID=1279 RepID=UPI00086F2B31|nr:MULTISPECIES: hypothetical protein [unclassified Staphylococcus]SCS91127.1 Uncharacterised protein [Staphylococcus cohnii subsp. cohnii]